MINEPSEQKYLWQVEDRNGIQLASVMEFRDNDSPLVVPQTVLELGSLSFYSMLIDSDTQIEPNTKELSATEVVNHLLDFIREGEVIKLSMPKGPEALGRFLTEVAHLELPDSLRDHIAKYEDDWPGQYL